jgi:hypothetical protein
MSRVRNPVLPLVIIALLAVVNACNERALLRTKTEQIDVPPSIATTLAPLDAVRFFLRKDALFVDGSDIPIVRRASNRASGFFVDDERRRWPGDLELPALGMVTDARNAQGASAAVLELDGEATYREVAGLISTIGRHGLAVWLAVDHSGERRAIPIVLHFRRAHGAPISPSCLLVTMEDGEIMMGTADHIPGHTLLHTEPHALGHEHGASPFERTIERGCAGFGSGPAVAPVDGDYDLAGLVRCGTAINHWPNGALGMRVLVPQAATPYRTVMAMFEAFRGDATGRGEFFLMAPPSPAP